MAILSALALLVASAGSASADEIDSYVESQRQAQHIPGLALLVVHNGEQLKALGYGLANVEHEVPVTAETIFQSGSVGKQFTAAALLLLFEDGKVGLDDPVRKFLPDAPDTWQPITVRQLLSHTGGVGDMPSGFDFKRDYTDDELLTAIYGVPLAYAPGTGWQYSNAGYVTLGILIRKISGQFYGDLLAERVFKPLEMKTARVISEADIIPHRAAGYRRAGGQLKNQEWVSPTMNRTADGSLYLTILDLARWDAGLRDDRLLKPATRQLMWTPVKLANGEVNEAEYGFGWVCTTINGRPVVEHGGAWQGFTSYIARYTDDRLTVAALANLSSDSRADPGKIVHHVAGLVASELMPRPPAPIEDTDPELTSRLRAVVEKLAAGNVDLEPFTAEVQARLTEPRLAEVKAQFADRGPLASFALVERKAAGKDRIYRYQGKFERGQTMLYTFRLTAGGKIARFGESSD